MSILRPDMLDKSNCHILSNEDMKIFEAEMQYNHIDESTWSSFVYEYDSRSDIEDIIGEDEEESNEFSEIEKIIEKKCKKSDVIVSFESNINIQHSMNNMKVTNEDMVKVAERCKAISNAHESSMTLSENLLVAYKATRPDLTDDEATETVNKLMKGCEELTREYNQAIAEGFDAEAEIAKLTKGMDLASRFNFLINALAAVEALNVSTFASQKDSNESIKKAIENYAASTPNPTESDCEAIQKLLVEDISNNTILLNGMEQAQELLASSKDSASVIDFASSQYDDARTKAEMALAMWIEYENGNISSIESGATPESVGIGAATAVEEAKIMNDVASGRTSADIAVKCLKILGGIALFLLLGYLGFIVAATVGGFAAAALLSVFGTSTIACIATMVICLPLLWGMAQILVNSGSFIMDKAGKVFDFVVEKLRESVFPKLKEVTSKIITWFKSKLGGRQTSTDTAIAMA